MKLQIASDFHLEYYGKEELPDAMELIQPNADCLALLGDIITLTEEDHLEIFSKYLKTYSTAFQHVFVLSGNHEYYNNNETKITMNEVDLAMEKICGNFENVHFLNKNSFCLNTKNQTVRIIGTTLWSHVPKKNEFDVSIGMNDYWKIFVQMDGKLDNLKVVDNNNIYKDHLEFIKREVKTAKANNEIAIILTHHAPVIEGSCDPKYDGSEVSCAISSNLKKLIKSRGFSHVKLWAYGHTHYNNSRTVGKTLVVSNQFGYKDKSECKYTYQNDFSFDILS